MFYNLIVLVSEAARGKLLWRIISYTTFLGLETCLSQKPNIYLKKVMKLNKHVEPVNKWLVNYSRLPNIRLSVIRRSANPT
jgi:hypothetical protein